MKNFAALVPLALSGSLFAQGVTLQSGDPAKLGCDAGKLAAAGAFVEQLVDQGELLGAVAMVVRGHTIVLHEAFGARDVRGKKPMRKDSLIRMASNTKAVTAAAVMTLVDEGKVGLDDPIAKWFPTFASDDAKKITVRQLMTHSSGLRINSLFLYPLSNEPSLVNECARFGKVGPKVEPGTSYSYSNPGYNLLAGLVEVVANKSFEDYCRERFYEPLGMKDTNNHESTADRSRMSVVVRGKKKGKWVARWSPRDKPTLPFVRGSGGMISTAEDFAKFCRMLLDGGVVGEQRLLSKEIVAAATRDQIPHLDKDYGFGWGIGSGGRISHTGSDGTYAFCDPERDLIGILFTQTQGLKDAAKKRARFRRLVESACPK